MKGNGIVTIHGREYMTVSRRVELAHEDKALESVETKVLSHNPVVIKARVTIKGKTYTGISSVNLESSRNIERENPYEVAETSAVGRALGFAGYGLIESIASADEVVNATTKPTSTTKPLACATCGQPAERKKGVSKAGREYEAVFCSTGAKDHTQWLISQ